MNLDRITNNYMFYSDKEQAEFLGEYVFTIKERTELNIHIWETYISDLFSNPIPSVKENGENGTEWTGMTRDYEINDDIFNDEKALFDLDDYINDLMQYKNARFEFQETEEVLSLIIDFLNYAKENNFTINIKYD